VLGQKSPSALLKASVILVMALILVPAAMAQSKFKVLHNFKGAPDGYGPFAGVTFDEKGNLYGTTLAGGPGRCNGGCGTVFELIPDGNGKWTETVVHGFPYSKNPPAGPSGGLVMDGRGDFYGSTVGGLKGGLLFEVTPAHGWKHYALPHEGSNWTLFMDKAGNVYGNGGGGVYTATPNSGGWKQSVIYVFHPQSGKDGTDGEEAVGTLISDANGNLYGATEFGGNYSLCAGGSGCGTVFELSPTGDGKWKEHVLYRFARFKDDGAIPLSGLMMDGEGSLYGVTVEGGNFRDNNVCLVGCGIVFKLSRGTNGRWKETILYNFSHLKDGVGPETALVFDGAGNLYGASSGGIGPCRIGCGVVFKLSPGANGKWSYSVLHRFSGPDGADPGPGNSLTLDQKGSLYGTAAFGGAYSAGVVYEISP
jgi:uncharacterized repeat protein (TIGR03803 family)